jgi:ATP-dependent Lon protease
MPEEAKKEACASSTAFEDVAGRGRVHRHAHLPRLAGGAALEQAHRGRDRPRKAKEVLDNDHYDLEKVKERILEYLAVRKMKPDIKGPILCFVGPPGVGKTSLGKSDRLGDGPQVPPHQPRRHARRGGDPRPPAHLHRRAARADHPGLRARREQEPVFMLDEIDKIGADFRGDPRRRCSRCSTRAEQHLQGPLHRPAVRPLEVLFITTANILDTVPPALRDRMEVIRLAGYIEEEKLHIARRHLIPRSSTTTARRGAGGVRRRGAESS